MENRVYGHNSGAQNPPMQKAAAFCPQRLLLSTKIPHFVHLFHIHVLECFQPLLCLRLCVAVADEAHRDEAQGGENRSIREKHAVVMVRIKEPAAIGVTTCATIENV